MAVSPDNWCLQELGAVDYRSQDFAELYKDAPFDFIFDSIGGESFAPHKVFFTSQRERTYNLCSAESLLF